MRGRGRKVRRLALVGIAGVALGGATALTLYAIGDKITYAPSPSELAAGAVEPGTRIRLGGLVRDGSVERGADGHVTFAVTDTATDIQVSYVGLLPDLFREGQGVVAEGTLQPSGTLEADTILARHDENYMPKEAADSLKAQGHWQDDQVTSLKDGQTR